jgi:hypothetical protein
LSDANRFVNRTRKEIIMKLEDLTVKTFAAASYVTKTQFENLVKALTPERDNEDGEDAWKWVLENNAGFIEYGPHATFIFSLKKTGEVVATCTFTPDDRGCLKNNDLKGLGVWGFVNVLRLDLRGCGLGSVIMQYLDDHIQDWVNRYSQNPADPVYLFTEAPEQYARFGFETTDIEVPFLDHGETLMVKNYKPKGIWERFLLT